MKKLLFYNDEITVFFQPELCKNSKICFSGKPVLFNPKSKKKNHADDFSSDEMIEKVIKCPSGALSFFYNNDLDDNGL